MQQWIPFRYLDFMRHLVKNIFNRGLLWSECAKYSHRKPISITTFREAEIRGVISDIWWWPPLLNGLFEVSWSHLIFNKKRNRSKFLKIHYLWFSCFLCLSLLAFPCVQWNPVERIGGFFKTSSFATPTTVTQKICQKIPIHFINGFLNKAPVDFSLLKAFLVWIIPLQIQINLFSCSAGPQIWSFSNISQSTSVWFGWLNNFRLINGF